MHSLWQIKSSVAAEKEREIKRKPGEDESCHWWELIRERIRTYCLTLLYPLVSDVIKARFTSCFVWQILTTPLQDITKTRKIFEMRDIDLTEEKKEKGGVKRVVLFVIIRVMRTLSKRTWSLKLCKLRDSSRLDESIDVVWPFSWKCYLWVSIHF